MEILGLFCTVVGRISSDAILEERSLVLAHTGSQLIPASYYLDHENHTPVLVLLACVLLEGKTAFLQIVV